MICSTGRFDEIDSPLGVLRLGADAAGLRWIRFLGAEAAPAPPSSWRRDAHELRPFTEALRAYFDGDLRSFDLPLAPEGTPFQLEAWSALRTIPFGQTLSYGQQARRVGRPKAARAVGAANGRNPIPIVIPCHRVVGARGDLVGFSSGLPIKRWLLEHEQAMRPVAV